MADQQPRIVVVAAHRPDEITAPLQEVGSAVEVVSLDPTKGFISRNLSALSETRQAIVNHDPDVVLSDCRELLGALVALVCFLSSVPFVFRFKGNHWRGLAASCRTKPVWSLDSLRYYVSFALDEALYSMATGFIVVSEELRTIVIERTGCPPDRVKVVHVPLVEDRETGVAAQASQQLEIDAETVVLTVTNLSYRGKYRGVKNIINGMKTVLADHETVSYVVAGGGPYLPDVRSVVDQSVSDPDIRSRIYTPGFVDNIEDLYALADIVVYVSYIDGYPRAVLEAQQTGLPVVANSAHGMVEQIDHEQTGLLLRQSDPETIAEHVEHLLQSETYRTGIGEQARQQVKTANNHHRIGPELVSALSDIVASRK